jgi:glycosyltransferase involved in cell wall biosynthesis
MDTTSPPKVDVVLPCLNEAAALPWVLQRMPPWARPIVADNGSTDRSAQLATDLGAEVVQVPQRGYGSACHAGLLAASAPLVAFMDADGSLDPCDLERLLTAHARDNQLVVGRRVPLDRQAWPWHLRMANRALSQRLRRTCGVQLQDVGPMRLADRESLTGLPITDRRSGYPLETVLRAAQAGWSVTPVDVPYQARVGRSKVTGTPLGAARAVLDMTRVLSS